MSGDVERREATSWLSDLPSRGTLINMGSGSLRLGMPAQYVCDHDTAPPEDQIIGTSATVRLRRILQRGIKRKLGHVGMDDGDQTQEKKRSFNEFCYGSPDMEEIIKRARLSCIAVGSGPPAQSKPVTSIFTTNQLQKLTKKEIQALLRTRQLPVSGNKNELISRVMDYQESTR